MNTAHEDLRWMILNQEEPIVFKNILSWDLLNWNLERWSKLFGNQLLQYRCGKRKITKNPQWEKNSDYITGTFSELLEFGNVNFDKFAYCDYKHLAHNFQDISELQNEIEWSKFGFPEYTSRNSTIWIGTQGAHTSCHKDTYGCNLVAQVYGRKRWLLFPPQENLQPTRVPYEESSVFSKLNLYSPDVQKFHGINNCKSIILNPGDVLFVPHYWWHYVENLETAISINIWIPKPEDDIKQFDESLVQFFISRLIKEIELPQREIMLTPTANNFDFEKETTLKNSLEVVNSCIHKYDGRRKTIKTTPLPQNQNNFNINYLIEKYKSFVYTITDLTEDEFQKLLQEQYDRFPPYQQEDEIKYDDILYKVINAFTSENVLDTLKANLLNL